MSGLDKNTGALVSADDAASMLQEYLQQQGIDPNNPPADKYWASYFGIDKLKALIAEIDSYNAGSKPNGEIMGVRVYKCISEHQKEKVESVLVTPVTADEKYLYPIRFQRSINQFTPNTILELAWPCPPKCRD